VSLRAYIKMEISEFFQVPRHTQREGVGFFLSPKVYIERGKSIYDGSQLALLGALPTASV